MKNFLRLFIPTVLVVGFMVHIAAKPSSDLLDRLREAGL